MTRETHYPVSILLGACFALCTAVSAQTINLVKDINTDPQPLSGDPIPGTSTFSTSGSRSRILSSEHFVAVGSKVLFVAETAKNDGELWVTDGTPAGTFRVKDIYPGPRSSRITSMIEHNGVAYFQAIDGVHGGELWRSDGTTAGTYLVKDAIPGSLGGTVESPIRFDATRILYSYLRNQTSTLWVSDGTAAGTVEVVAPGVLGAFSNEIAKAGSRAFLSTRKDLWMVDSTLTATKVRSFLGLKDLIGFGSDVLFTADDGSGTGFELWISDGTALGTKLVRDVWTGPGAGANLGVAVVHAGRLFFTGRSASGLSMWTSDGTTAGTIPIPNAPGSFVDAMVLGGKLYCSLSSFQLVESDGTVAGTIPISGFGAGRYMIAIGGEMYYRSVINAALMKSDGTAAGTQEILRMWTLGQGSNVLYLQQVGTTNKFVFSANDGVNGQELWISDGTTAGTMMLEDIQGVGYTKSANPDWFAELDCDVYFSATDASGAELWVSDGTAAGTTQVVDLNPGSRGSNPQHLVTLGNRILFSADDGSGAGRELWITDGTAGGTSLLADIRPGSAGSNPSWMTRIGNLVYFQAAGTTTAGAELWVTDGTLAGTNFIYDVDPTPNRSSSPRYFCELGYSGVFVFQANVTGDGIELWKSDGTSAGTSLLKSVPGTAALFPTEMTRVAGGKVVFAARTSSEGTELWITDGTPANTVILKDIVPGGGSSTPSSFTFADEPGTAHFVAFSPSTGREIWRTDGTPTGTYLQAQTKSGTGSLSPRNLTIVGNRDYYYSATDATNGRELWKSPGVPSAVLVGDLNPGKADSDPKAQGEGGRKVFADSVGRVFFAADDGVKGSELRVVDPGAWWRQLGRPCGFSGTQATLWTGTPKIGTLWTFNGRNSPLNWTAVTAIGLKPTQTVQGCGLHVFPLIYPMTFPVTNPSWSYGISIPNDNSLAGIVLSVQVGYVETGPPLRIDFTNAILGVVGQ